MSECRLKSGARLLRRLLAVGLGCTWAQASVRPLVAQEATESPTGEKAVEEAKKPETMPGYNLQYGPVSFQVGAGLHTEFTDNALNTAVDRKSDEIVMPELDLRSYWPITELNALTFSLGLDYQYYVNNTQLNPDTPLISPGSELALVLYVKNFRFRFHERLSYQESIFYTGSFSVQTGEFINLSNIGTFGRLDNFAGFTADWDLNDIVFTLRYDHEDFISELGELDYLTRSSELFSLESDVILGPEFRSGLEAKGSWNTYDTAQLPENWRARVGPFVDMKPTDYITFRVGGGYEDVSTERVNGLATDYTPYYAYARATHRVNDWLSYTLTAAHENQIGWNTADLQSTYVGISPSLRFVDHLEINPGFTYGLGKEAGAYYTGTYYHEDFSFFDPYLSLVYSFGEHWKADLRYEYFQKDSDLHDFGFYRNRVTIGVTYRF